MITNGARLAAVVTSVACMPLTLSAWVGVGALNGQATPQAGAPHLLDDGPHVYWTGDSEAFVFYVCDGEFEAKVFLDADPLRFNGMCGDSAVEYTVPARAPDVERYEFTDVDHILAVSDIHGDYEELTAFLETARVIDQNLRWSWGRGHLVILGDVFDRGDRVTECLWLIHRLEREAREAGGRVHYVLGNHELMVLHRDHRYVNEKYLRGIVDVTTLWYEDLFGPDMELGRWLRTKHAAVRLNHVLFVHGGLGPAAVARGLDLDELNQVTRASIDMRSYELVFGEEPRFVLGVEGPFWYRGYHGPLGDFYERITSEQLQEVLGFYDAESVVVGHTEIGGIESLFDGRVFGIDVPVDKLGGFEGLLWHDGTFYRVLGDGSTEGF